MGDFNIDITNKGVELDKLDEFCDLFNLTNLITSPTCFTKTHKSTIDLILTNKESCFQKAKVTETGLSDFHKLISTFLRSQFCRLKPKKIHYRNFKNFNEENFLEEVKNTDFRLNSDDPNENYELITNVFSNIVEKHTSLKKKFLRGNQAPFMTKEFRKAIYNRSRLRNKFCKIPSEENEKLYKKQRNRCVAIRKKSIRNYFNKIANRNILTNRNFWKISKPFLSNKGHLENVDIMLNHNNRIICNNHELVKIFNEHYINIIEKSGGEKPTNITEEYSFDNDKKAIEIICNSYKNHPSTLKIRSEITVKENINNTIFSPVNRDEVKQCLQKLNPRKAIGQDKISPALIKMAAEPLSTPLSIAINNSFKYNIFLSNAQVACVKPLDKKTEDKHCISNFRPVSILNTSKIYEMFAKNLLVSNIEEVFSPFLIAYRKSYSTQHVLIRMVEEWKENLDNNFIVGAVLTDLSKAFDCKLHDLLIAKLSAYGLNSDSLCYIYSYLKDRKHCVQINNEQSEFDTMISGVPQGSIFGPILYNIFFNDFFFFIPKASVHNFADDNTLASFASTLKELLPILESECEAAINWLHNNKMIVNSDKFQVILLDKRGSDNTNIELKIGTEKIKSTSSVKLLGVHIDDKLNFNHHINKLCQSAGNQLNALTRLKSFLGLKERAVLVNSFIYSNFDYCPLVWMFSHKKSLDKIESLHERALRFLLNDYENSYEELLEKSRKCNMSLQRIRFLCIEI